MTTEEKAKAYDEAIRVAKNELKQDLHESGIWAIKRIFPELTESEDERIRQEIISALKFANNGGVYDKHIAYLEKQKEHQNNSDAPNESSWSGIFTSPLCKDKNLDDIAQEYVEGVKEYNPTPDWNLIHTAVCYGYHLADQKEQKSAEWSEEDEKMLKNVLFVLESFVSNTESKSSPSLIASYHTYYKEIDWLKSLRPQPHWKPSEEQMEALEYVIRDYREDSCNATANYLQEIFDHLKNM